MIESKPSIESEKARKYFLKEMQASGTYRRHCRRQSHPRICQNFWQFFGKDPQPQSSLIAQIWWLWQGMNIRLYIISRVINLRRSNFLIAANSAPAAEGLSQIWFWQLFIASTSLSSCSPLPLRGYYFDERPSCKTTAKFFYIYVAARNLSFGHFCWAVLEKQLF